MPPLPHFAVEEIKLSMAPSLQRHYSPSSLLRTTPPSCCLQPLSRVSSYRADLLQRFLLGTYRTSPVSVVSLSPCRRQYPAGVDYPFSQCEIAHTVFADIQAAQRAIAPAKAVAFWQRLGFELEFETDHGSGMSRMMRSRPRRASPRSSRVRASTCARTLR